MAMQMAVFAFGSLLMLVAILGGGFEVKELKVPSTVTVLEDPEELVVKIVHKRELKVEEEVPAAEGVVPAEGEGAAAGEAPAEQEAAETEE